MTRVVLLVALLGLAGCGFHPLYGEDSAVGGAELSRVHIATIQDAPDPTGRSASIARVAQQLRNFLLDRVTPRGTQGPALYELRVTLSESKSTALGIRSDESATRGVLSLSAGYSLVRLRDSASILSTSTRAQVSYNVLRDEFATLSAEKDAQRLAAKELSETIALDVANAVGAARQGIVK